MDDAAMERALGLLGPLEARLMRAVWSGQTVQPFVVRDVLGAAPNLAYTTVMTTLNRLASKGLLRVAEAPGQRAYRYEAAITPTEFLDATSREHVTRLFDQFGDSVIPALAECLRRLAPDQRDRLRRLMECA